MCENHGVIPYHLHDQHHRDDMEPAACCIHHKYECDGREQYVDDNSCLELGLVVYTENLPVVVPGEAVQNMDGEEIIFIKDGDIYEPVVIVTGRRDGKRVEVISGLKQGMTYVAQGAFELKSIMVTSGMDSHAGHGH